MIKNAQNYKKTFYIFCAFPTMDKIYFTTKFYPTKLKPKRRDAKKCIHYRHQLCNLKKKVLNFFWFWAQYFHIYVRFLSDSKFCLCLWLASYSASLYSMLHVPHLVLYTVQFSCIMIVQFFANWEYMCTVWMHNDSTGSGLRTEARLLSGVGMMNGRKQCSVFQEDCDTSIGQTEEKNVY